jgi:hypothetical protein
LAWEHPAGLRVDIQAWRLAEDERLRSDATSRRPETHKDAKQHAGNAVTTLALFALVAVALVLLAAVVFLAGRGPSWSTSGRDAYGMAGIIYPANDVDSSALIEEARELALVFNDMRLWLPGPRGTGKHLAALQRRLDAGRRTRIFLLHPKSPFLSEVARVSGKDVKEQADEIERAVVRLCDGRWDKVLPKDTLFEQRPLQIIGHPRYNTYSMIMTEAEARVNYYPIGFRGREDLGHFHVYKPTVPDRGMYERMARDLDVIKAIAENTFNEDMDLVQYYYNARQQKNPG